MPTRRSKGDGSLTQRHDHPTCPPLVDGERPAHPCRGRWVAVVDLGHAGGKRRRKALYGKTKEAARRKLNAAMREREDTGSIASSAMTVEAWLTYWLDVICVERGLKINTLKSHRSKVKTYLIPHLGNLRLDRLEPEHVRAMYAAMKADGIADATRRQTHAILRRALEVAQREGKVRRNVASLIDPPSVAENKRGRISAAGVKAIRATENLRAHVALMGLRQGEALALRWSDVDLDLGQLDVSRSLSRQPGVGYVFGTPKSAAGNRLVPIPPRALALFKLAHLDRLDDDALVFHDGTGSPVHPRRDWQEWSDLLAELGIPHVPLHVARNTAASILEELGYPPRLVGEIIGQSQVSTTHRYQTGTPEVHREAMLALEAYETATKPRA